jgi:hypothetical protein
VIETHNQNGDSHSTAKIDLVYRTPNTPAFTPLSLPLSLAFSLRVFSLFLFITLLGLAKKFPIQLKKTREKMVDVRFAFEIKFISSLNYALVT